MSRSFIAALVLAAGGVWAVQSDYAGQQKRAIKALSESDIEGLRAGRGMGYAKVAELNSYPGPMHVLELASELKLTDDQRKKVEASMASMRKQAKELGAKIIEAETKVDRDFRAGKADPKTVSAELETIGKLNGQLRWAHVKAHIETRKLLTKTQIAKYDELRGYTEAKR